MSLLATRARMEGEWYDPPYRELAHHELRERAIRRLSRGSVAVWGCAYGYLVRRLVDAGRDAHGFDASEWAVRRGRRLKRTRPIAARLHVRSCTSAADVAASLEDAGLERFALVVTEDMLPCLTDRELRVALPLLRATGRRVIHIVSVSDFHEQHSKPNRRLNWKSAEQWRELCAPDLVYSANTDRVIE